MFNNSLKLFNNKITSNYFENYYELYIKYWRENKKYIRGKYVSIFDFTFEYNNYLFIQKYTTITLNKFGMKKYKKIVKEITLSKILKKDIIGISIVKSNYSNIYTIQYEEILKESKVFYALKNKKKLSILNINNKTNNNLAELLMFYQKKLNIKNIDYNSIIFEKYNFDFKKTSNIIIKSNLELIKELNLNIIDTFINVDFILTHKNKYDIINNSLKSFNPNNNKNYHAEFIEISQIQINFLTFLFALNNLNKGGIFIIHTGGITTKANADILLIGKKYFKEVIPCQSQLKTWQFTGVSVIFNGFKGIPKKDFDNLIKIAKKLLRNDPTSLGFTVNDDKIRKKYNFVKPKNSKYKYIKEFLKLPITSPEYQFIIEFNKQLYMNKSIYLEKMLNYKAKYFNLNDTEKQMIKKVPDEVREEQMVHSIMYCKKYGIETIDLDRKGTFENEFGRLIINDLYSQYSPIKQKILHTKIRKNLSKLDLIDELEKLSGDLAMSVYSLEKRDISKYIFLKDKLVFYQKDFDSKLFSLSDYVSKKYTKYKVTKEWLSFQEILSEFNILNENIKNIFTFHLNEAPGYFIKSLCYDLERKNKCIKCFEWNAQTLHPSIDNMFSNDYNLLTKFQNRWKFGVTEDGDITNIENLKSYKNICKKIKLLTADGGEKNISNEISLNQLKFSEFVFMFHNLPKTGNFVIRLYLPFEDRLFIDMVYLMYKNFKSIYFYKPLENLFSGEFYLVCLNYKGISDKTMKLLLKLLKNYNTETKDKSIFEKDYSESFKHQIFNIIKKFTQNYIFNINKQLYYFDNKKFIPKEHFQEINKIFMKKNKDWVNEFLHK